jgi:Fe2+ or Zn2+ uptake regulation protein
VHTPAELTESFRRHGRKITPQRVAVFNVLHRNDTHPTAESVYDTVAADMPSISLRTVYQTLNDLAAMGEIRSLDLGTGSMRFDPNTGDHHHLVCDRCGTIRDVLADVAGVTPDRLDGFVVETTHVIFRGVCESCCAAGQAPPTTSRTRKEVTSHG